MFEFFPIAYVRNGRQELYQVPFQTGLIDGFQAIIEFEDGYNFKEALKDLEGMERIWVVFAFHKAKNWKPKIFPPRGDQKRGLFATRSPHRPNPIGMSAVKLVKVEGLKLYIEDHDLIDGTPVLDIKPYLPYVDSFSEAAHGWLENERIPEAYELLEEGDFTNKLQWLSENGELDLLPFIDVNLKLNPFPRRGNRIVQDEEGNFILAVKTWRVHYRIEEGKVVLENILSGYERDYIEGTKESKWDDVPIHQAFLKVFCQK